MTISKTFAAPNGAPIAFHRIGQACIDYETGFAKLTIRSYVSEQAIIDKVHAWTDDYVVPAAGLGGDLARREDVEQALIALADLPFYGGAIVADLADTLDAARARAWAAIKAARSAAEEGSFTFDGGSYQADKVRINGAVQLAVLAKSSGAEFSETWTLTDNTTRTLSAAQVIALGTALGQYVSDLYATGRALRAQIEAAETIEAVRAVIWPAPNAEAI